MVVGNNKSTATKYAGESMAISIAMAMQWYDAGRIARWITSGASLKPLDAAIGQVPAPYCPGDRHGRRIH
jgi:hypothetical protein